MNSIPLNQEFPLCQFQDTRSMKFNPANGVIHKLRMHDLGDFFDNSINYHLNNLVMEL